jgi:hypothetical protein
MDLSRLKRLPIGAPPTLAEVIGVRSEARYFSICYEGSKPFWTDGRAGSTFSYHSAYEPYVKHLTMAIHLLGVNLGSDDEPPTYALLIDREEGGVYVGAYGEVRSLLNLQHPPRRPPTPEEIEEMDKELARMEQMSPDDMRERGMFEFLLGSTERQRERCWEMVSWLDECIDENLILSYLQAAGAGNLEAIYHLRRFQQRVEASDSINTSSDLVH